MKAFQFLFYFYFLAFLRTYNRESKSDYTHFNAIVASLLYSVFLFFNIQTVLNVLGFYELTVMAAVNLGYVFFPIMASPIVFVYFSCIHKKKYLEIVERFKHWDNNWKSRLIGALIVFLYGVGTFVLLFLSVYFFVGFE